MEETRKKSGPPSPNRIIPFSVEEYLAWVERFEAGYGRPRPDATAKQVAWEIEAIPEAIRDTYLAEKYIGRERLRGGPDSWPTSPSPIAQTDRTGEGVREYRVQENAACGTWSIVELWPGGISRSPFQTRQEAKEWEEEFARRQGQRVRQVEFSNDELALLGLQNFPRRTQAIGGLGDYDVIYVHRNGSLTVRSRGKFYIVTTDGGIHEWEHLSGTAGVPERDSGHENHRQLELLEDCASRK